MIAVLALLAGCRVSPVPLKIDEYYRLAHELYPQVNDVLQEGDVVFRKGHFYLLNGPINYSTLLAYWCASPFSHVGLAYQKVGDTWVILNTDAHGVKRTFLIDWLIEGPENIAVKRLKAEQRDKLPLILAEARRVVERDTLHDEHYGEDTDRLYCSQIVDHCFREAGLPLAPLVPVGHLPRINIWYMKPLYWAIATSAGIDLESRIAVCGNEFYGMYSSPHLEEVLNLLPPKYDRLPFARPRDAAAPAPR